jgi:hypothetical protein
MVRTRKKKKNKRACVSKKITKKRKKNHRMVIMYSHFTLVFGHAALLAGAAPDPLVPRIARKCEHFDNGKK